MPSVMVGLLAAVGTAMSALVAFAHGDLVWLTIATAAVVTGLAAYVAARLQKNSHRLQMAPNGSTRLQVKKKLFEW